MALHRAVLRAYGSNTHYSNSKSGSAAAFEGALFHYNARKFGATGNLDVTEENENATRNALFQMMKSGDVFYDIGAHGGVFTITAQRRVAGLKVYSFEPQPKELLLNLALNNLAQDRVFQVAVGDQAGTVRMTSDKRSSNHLSESGDLEVECVRLDDFRAAKDLPPPTWIKIDIEGMELPAFKGFAKTLAEAQPVIICEINHVFNRFGASLPDLIGFFKALDYIVLANTAEGFTPANMAATELDDLGRSADENFWFVPNKDRSKFLNPAQS
ncbi:FkbM family methyltransferase [Yoonia sp. R2331]|uniref:FkbM family methyltransferase n=1 Tax=Yoonia sp. R2331 TaxID=3237238 RepID=UPI0034E3E608